MGGKEVKETEYRELRYMMDVTELYEVDTQGEKLTWFNKHTKDPIYSCIDRVIGNLEWIDMNKDKSVYVMEPGVSDHALLCIKSDDVRKRINRRFKFFNVVTEREVYLEAVKGIWQSTLRGDQKNSV